MRFTLRAAVASVTVALSLAVVGAAGAVPRITALQPCEVDLAGLGTVDGSGQYTDNVQTCTASIDQTLIDGTQLIRGQACSVLITASGRVKAVCHS